MLNKKQIEDPDLMNAIARLHADMATWPTDSADYDLLVKQLERLNALRQSTPEKRKPVDPNTLITAGASIAGIVIIVAYEHGHAVTSKAMSLILKK